MNIKIDRMTAPGRIWLGLRWNVPFFIRQHFPENGLFKCCALELQNGEAVQNEKVEVGGGHGHRLGGGQDQDGRSDRLTDWLTDWLTDCRLQVTQTQTDTD